MSMKLREVLEKEFAPYLNRERLFIVSGPKIAVPPIYRPEFPSPLS